MSRVRQHILRAMVFLLLGMTINIGVAWGLAAWRSPGLRPMPDYDDTPSQLATWYRLNKPPDFPEVSSVEPVRLLTGGSSPSRGSFELTGWSDNSVADGMIAARHQSLSFYRRTAIANNSATSWMPVRTDVHALSVTAGWPMPSLTGSHWMLVNFPLPGQNLSADDGALPLSTSRPLVWSGVGPMPNRLLPLRPIVWAFAVNSMLYAVLAYLMCVFVLAVRETVRRRRGLCVKCAYNLGASSIEHARCPECGHARVTMHRQH